MTDMNGQESANGLSHHDANGLHACPIEGPTTDGLTKQQLLILQHLQKGESITPWIAKYQYHCESVFGVICALRKKGWNIKTSRRTDKQGKKFPSYRLWTQYWSQYERGEQDKVPGPLFVDPSESPDPEADSQEIENPVDEVGKPTNIEIIRDHMIAEKGISPQTATEKYGLSSSTLRAVISTLRGKHDLHIETVRVPGKEARYKLLDLPRDIAAEDPVADSEHERCLEVDEFSVLPDTSEKEKPAPEPKSVPVASSFATITGLRKTKEGIELGLAVEEDLDDKPPYKLKVPDAEALLTMLRYLLESR